MSVPNRTVVVIGATGRQGGSATRHLLRNGWHVRALVRNPSNEEAKDLIAAGADLVVGTMEDRVSLDQAMKDAHGVFSVQPAGLPFSSFTPEDELRCGANVAESAAAAGVRHLVHASVGGAGRNGFFETKRDVERVIKATGLPATILRPVSFMENHINPRHPFFPRNGTLTLPIGPDVPLQLVAVDDIGAFATLAFENPAVYQDMTIELAGDDLSGPQIAAAFGEVSGEFIKYESLFAANRGRNDSPNPAGYEYILRYGQWIAEGGYSADIPLLRRAYPGLTSFRRWLEDRGQTALSSALHPSPPGV
jgi:uncharacterized protein YbjT (DUF2867 family)